MPTRVQNRPAEMSRGPSEKFSDHDASNINRNIQHKEALSLRLALGSILGPKRPFTPSSHSSSGTASPAHPASFGTPTSPALPPPPTSTPIHPPDGRFDTYLHPRHVYLPHTPSRLGQYDTKEPHWPPGGSPLASAPSSAPMSPHSTQSASPTEEFPPPLSLPPPVVEPVQPRPSLHAPKPVSAPSHLGAGTRCTSGSGSGTPKAKFLETLDSNRAWDALIHGSFS